MKRRSNTNIMAADEMEIGTTIYEVTEQMLKDFYADDDNIVTQFIIDDYGFDAFDLSRMYGSKLIGDTLYICVTDGVEILIDTPDGEIEEDPEQLLDIYDIDYLESLIEPATDEILKRYVSYYDFDISKIDLDYVAKELIDAGHHFKQIVEDAKDIDLLDDILY